MELISNIGLCVGEINQISNTGLRVIQF